jgi:hypothetical protein
MTIPDLYFQLYQHCQLAKQALDRAIAAISQAENANDTTQYCSVKTKKQKYVGWVEEQKPTFSMICWFYTIGCLRGNFR